MALNLLSVLPPLYNAQKVLVDYANKYGKTIFIDPSKDTGYSAHPSIQANVAAMSMVAENLIQYFRMKSNVKDTYAKENGIAKIYMSMALTIIIIVLAVAVGIGFTNRYNFMYTDTILDLMAVNGLKDGDELDEWLEERFKNGDEEEPPQKGGGNADKILDMLQTRFVDNQTELDQLKKDIGSIDVNAFSSIRVRFLNDILNMFDSLESENAKNGVAEIRKAIDLLEIYLKQGDADVEPMEGGSQMYKESQTGGDLGDAMDSIRERARQEKGLPEPDTPSRHWSDFRPSEPKAKVEDIGPKEDANPDTIVAHMHKTMQYGLAYLREIFGDNANFEKLTSSIAPIVKKKFPFVPEFALKTVLKKFLTKESLENVLGAVGQMQHILPSSADMSKLTKFIPNPSQIMGTSGLGDMFSPKSAPTSKSSTNSSKGANTSNSKSGSKRSKKHRTPSQNTNSNAASTNLDPEVRTQILLAKLEDDQGDRIDKPKFIFYLCLGILLLIVFAYLLFLVIELYRRNAMQFSSNLSKYPDSLCNFEHKIETGQIGSMVQKFQVSGISGTTVYIANNPDPALLWAYKVMHPNMNLVSNSPVGSSAAAGGRASQTAVLGGASANPDHINSKAGQVTDEVATEDAPLSMTDVPPGLTYVTFFDGNTTIDPYALRSQIQSFDLFQQLDRMQTAVVYLQSVMLKQFDDMYKNAILTKTLRQSINDKIVDLLTHNCTIVTDLQSTSQMSFPNISSASACFNACLNSEQCVASSYDPSTRTCYLMKEQDKVNYRSNCGQSMLLKNTSHLLINSTTIDTSVFSQFSSNTCSNTEPYCLTVDTSSFLPDVNSIPYSHLFTGTTQGQYSLNIPTTDVIAQNKKAIPQVYIVLKDWLTNQICKVVQAADASKTYNLDQSDSTYITNKISTYLGAAFNVASGPLNDILTHVPAMIVQMYTNADTDPLENQIDPKYVPTSRFIEKVGAMDSETFITNMVFYANEMYACTKGITILNQDFYNNIQGSINATTTMIQNMSCGTLMICSFLGVSGFLTNTLMKKKDGHIPKLLALNEEIKDLTIKINTMSLPGQAAGVEDKDKDPKKLLKELKEKRLEMNTYMTMKCCIVTSLTLMFVSMIVGTVGKKRAIANYNKQVLGTIGQELHDNCITIMGLYHSDIIDTNSYGIKASSVTTTFNNPNLTIDPWASATTHPTQDLYFQNIIQQTNISKDLKVQPIFGNNLETIYLESVNALEAYGKCNSLFSLSSAVFPFPIVEITVYGSLMIMTFLVIGYIYVKLQPIANLKQVKLVNILLANNEANKGIAKDDLPSDVLDFSEEDKGFEHTFNHNMIMFGAILFLVFALIFAALATQSGTDMENVLYSSKLFQDSQCYPPDLQK